MDLDKSFLEYVINNAEDLKEQDDLLHSLFPPSIQCLISERIGNSNKQGTEVNGIVAALMFAGADIKDKDGLFYKHIIQKLYRVDGNGFYKTQQELSSFLFGISVDYVSNLL